MREIKFRAWEKERKEMLEVLGIFFDVGTISHKPLMLKGNTNPFSTGYPNTYLKDIELMQYTGLKDKNGVEIYEGDIVRHYDYPYCKAGGQSVVRWDDCACGFEPFTEEIADYGHPIAGEWIEVIGNIWETPELLEENYENKGKE